MWYSAMVIAEASSKRDEAIETVYQVSIVLITADSDEEANERAEAWGRQQEHSYSNCYNELVFWRFIRVDEVQRIDDAELQTGTEVFYRMYFPIGDSESTGIDPQEYLKEI